MFLFSFGYEDRIIFFSYMFLVEVEGNFENVESLEFNEDGNKLLELMINIKERCILIYIYIQIQTVR